jgi:hypothetical protein
MIVTSISNNLPLRGDHWDLSLIPLMINTSIANNLPLRGDHWDLLFVTLIFELWSLLPWTLSLCRIVFLDFVPSCFVIFDNWLFIILCTFVADCDVVSSAFRHFLDFGGCPPFQHAHTSLVIVIHAFVIPVLSHRSL